MKKILNKIVLLLILLTLICGYYIFGVSGNILVFKDGKFDYFSKAIIKICSKEAYKPGCYDREIPKILEKGFVTMEEAFAVTSKIQQEDRSYLYCHILGHNLADVETRKDPSKWLDVITRCPTLACNNGCSHGAVMRKFKGTEVLSNTQIDEITPDLQIACEPRGTWKPTELERSMCYHSMGHLGLYITGADIDKSLNLCRKVTIKDDGRNYYQTCVSGVFMLVFQSLDNDDAALVQNIKPTKEDVVNFCDKYSGLENIACRTESWPYYFEEFKDPKGLTKFCDFTKDKYYRNWCFDTGLRGGVTLRILQEKGNVGVSEFCMGLPKDMNGRCFASVANSWVQDEPNYITESLGLCQEATRYGFGEVCYNGLLYFSKFSFDQGTDLWRGYCNKFPEVYKEKCLNGDVPDSW